MMLKWKYLGKERKTKMLLGIGMCLLTISSLSVSTAAWFNARYGKVTVTFGEVLVNTNKLKFQVKYYSGNWNDTTKTFSGYRDPRVPGAGGTVVQHVTSYDTQFIPISGGKFTENGPLDIRYATPGYCHTFAIEITSDFSVPHNVELRLTKFTSPESTTNRIVDENDNLTTRGVVLASDIDIYSQGYALSSTDSVNAANATTFMSTNMLAGPTDYFQYDDVLHDLPAGGYQFWNGVAPANTSFTVLFTIEFTDLPNSKYRYVSQTEATQTDPVYDYWKKGTDGTHAPYNGLDFTINEMYVNDLGESGASSSSSSASASV